MRDLIDRQAAIDALEDAKKIYVDRKVIIAKMQDIINNLPSAERKKGKWIPQEDEEGYPLGCACSECGKSYVMPEGLAYYCPNCGADMRGEEG